MSNIPTASSRHASSLKFEDLNPHVVEARYAVRGEVVLRAAALRKKLESGEKLPFDSIIPCNIGNPQGVGQKPITYFRQVFSF